MPDSEVSPQVSRTTAQVLTFILDRDTFALPIDRVREVVEFDSVTRVPRSRPYVRGLLNLRGNVLPVVDLRKKLGLGDTAKTVDTCVIVVEVEVEGESIVVGALADAVREVATLPEGGGLDQVPSYGLEVPAEFLHGLVRREHDLVLVLHPDRAFADIAEAIVADSMSERDDRERDHDHAQAQPAAQA